MRIHLKRLANKVSFWNLFIGIVIGFGVGVWFLSALIPNATNIIRVYRNLDRQTRIQTNYELSK
jgi:hypothetical protein